MKAFIVYYGGVTRNNPKDGWKENIKFFDSYGMARIWIEEYMNSCSICSVDLFHHGGGIPLTIRIVEDPETLKTTIEVS